MDYQHAAYFAGAQQYGPPFIGIPPLTPAHSNSVASDDFHGPASSPDVFDPLMPTALNAHDHFAPYDQFAAFTAQNSSFPRPPTPPNPATTAVHAPKRQPNHQPNQPPASLTSLFDRLPMEELEDATLNPRQGSTEDEDLTPAQSRRKAQNRAAQRAFRERKEKHLKELEDRLHELETAQQQAISENEKLKRDLQKMSTENEILRATSHLSVGPGSNGSPARDGPKAVPVPLTTGPLSYNPTDFYSTLLAGHQNKKPSHRIVTSDSGERLLAAGATWDLIMSHDLFKRGLVDIQSVSDRLKGLAKCDGQGPVFEEGAIVAAIQESAAIASDELL